MSTTASAWAKCISPAVTVFSRLLGTSAGDRCAGRSTAFFRRTFSGASSVGTIIQDFVSWCSASASVPLVAAAAAVLLADSLESGRYAANASRRARGR